MRRMGKFFSALLGLIVGFVVAHMVNQTPEGRAFFARARATLSSLVSGFQSGYQTPKDS